MQSNTYKTTGIFLLTCLIWGSTWLAIKIGLVFSIFYLALFGSLITFTCYYWLLKRVNIIIVSLITFITPVIALFLGWLFYREELSISQSVGCVLVLTGLLTAIFGNFGKVLNKKV